MTTKSKPPLGALLAQPRAFVHGGQQADVPAHGGRIARVEGVGIVGEGVGHLVEGAGAQRLTDFQAVDVGAQAQSHRRMQVLVGDEAVEPTQPASPHSSSSRSTDSPGMNVTVPPF